MPALSQQAFNDWVDTSRTLARTLLLAELEKPGVQRAVIDALLGE
jgi:hypothetical protein